MEDSVMPTRMKVRKMSNELLQGILDLITVINELEGILVVAVERQKGGQQSVTLPMQEVEHLVETIHALRKNAHALLAIADEEWDRAFLRRFAMAFQHVGRPDLLEKYSKLAGVSIDTAQIYPKKKRAKAKPQK